VRTTLTVLVWCSLATAVSAQDDATAAWSHILQKCAKSTEIGKESLFFGLSNTVGPGSVWRFADDGSVRLMFELSDAFPAETSQAAMISKGAITPCSGKTASKWSLHLRLPFSTGLTPVSVDIDSELGKANSVSVSVKGFAIDALKETVWKDKFRALDQQSPYKAELMQPTRIVAENAVKVTGLKAVYSFSKDLSVNVQAKFKGKTFTLGNTAASPQTTAASPGTNPTTINSAGAGNARPLTKVANNGNTNPNANGKDSKTNPPATTTSAAGSCGPSSASESDPAPTSSPTANGSSGVATIHADVTGKREITLCADGPFYMLAAYSKLQSGNPIGLKSNEPAPLLLIPTIIPGSVAVGNDRKNP
jgi:hypothetical protein